ncbi:hypothetical protein ATE68_21990 [Sphingopyxis sp. H038]|nr:MULTISPECIES: hypothetical protein [unclassified Sphingopyxis]KTE02880.1 hypothetical protein ATE78_06015 [Sphingopyxis sp. H012]KTE23224.1 hypothetical protein ATE75_19730 [Sphingopyxis sp. H080]KTE31338.1 hypothetical protein ATE68_21990 [Sphingopyxis sp. H038]KTE37677.1 hypothetical protein ATE73_21350 [Sphingopyxis sp. H077]KTE38500.1 hypothetical protein ATE77_22900 [Sphingopyxis sp. H005]
MATSDAAFRGGACPTPEYTIAYTGNYTTSADANLENDPRAIFKAAAAAQAATDWIHAATGSRALAADPLSLAA